MTASLRDALEKLVNDRLFDDGSPTGEQIEQALQECGIGSYRTIVTDAVLALMGGAEREAGSEFLCAQSPDGRHNTVPALGGNDEPLGYNHCGYCGYKLDW